jgi:putative ABC transport system permease protein
MPLNQSIRLLDTYFDVIGVCLDPVNNGNVTYVPLKTLQNTTGILKPNIVMVKIDASVNRADILNHIRTKIENLNSEFEVFELNGILDKNLSFLSYIWSTIMFLPLFSLIAASLCSIGYVILTVTEQRQEFGVLRAVGAKPRTVVKIISGQSFIVLLSSYAAGIAIGIILALLILVPEPLVTSYIVIKIAGWLLTALAATFIFSLYPAIKFARKPILEIMA